MLDRKPSDSMDAALSNSWEDTFYMIFKLYVRLLTFLGIVTLLKDLHPLCILPHDAGEHLLKHRHSVGLFATQEDGRLLATNHKENIGHL